MQNRYYHQGILAFCRLVFSGRTKQDCGDSRYLFSSTCVVSIGCHDKNPNQESFNKKTHESPQNKAQIGLECLPQAQGIANLPLDRWLGQIYFKEEFQDFPTVELSSLELFSQRQVWLNGVKKPHILFFLLVLLSRSLRPSCERPRLLGHGEQDSLRAAWHSARLS